MPILWRYLIGHFVRIVCLCILAFVAILLTMRLDEIAHFAALGAPLPYLLVFILNQIPYILPIALPLSCLIASFLLIQSLSQTHELTALRASGFALLDILAPILVTAAFLTLGNFWMASELATHSHLQTNLLKSERRALNPLLLLHNKHLMRLKGFYFEALGASQVGESARDVVLAIPNRYQSRLNLMIAKQLNTTPSAFIGRDVTLFSSIANPNEDFDHLIAENIKESATRTDDFSSLIQKKVWTIHNDYLQLPLLLARIQEQRQLIKEAQEKGIHHAQLKSLKIALQRSLTEINKRFSIALAVFSFTLMGAALGIKISRKRHHYPLYLAIGLTTFYLIAFFLAKSLDHFFWLAACLYLLPHFFIILVSLTVLKRVTRGIE